MENTNYRELKMTRTVKAPIDLVWKAWTEPGYIAQWWGPDEHTTTIHEMDFRVGGEWKLTLHNHANGQDYPNRSVFKEIVPLKKIVFEHFNPHFIATVLFEAKGEETQIEWSSLFDTEEMLHTVVNVFNAKAGQAQNFERLEKYLQESFNKNPSSKNSKIIHATKAKVYNAFTDKKALEYWLAPNDMKGKIHDLDLKVGGGYEMSLFYLDNQRAGKTLENEDRFSATFIELEPYEKIVQAINFKSDKSEFTEEMTMETFLEEAENNSTKVTVIFKNIPAGVDPKDNEAGTEQSLEKLRKYLEQ